MSPQPPPHQNPPNTNPAATNPANTNPADMPTALSLPTESAAPPIPQASPAPIAPRQLGPYHILETLGDGGMGTVYKAEQRHPLKRIVALKVIKPGFDTQEVIARFESERQALARMDHPHIAKVLDAGTTDLGRPYFVMEYVPGIPITTFADQQTLTIRQRLELFVQVCQAIAHAHSKALIHRDIKSGNVLAYLSDGQPRAVVIDFGIAKALSGEKLVDFTLTSGAGMAIGTPHSMSPEQADGSPDIDTRTDVYSLGVLLYELLTGRKPFEIRDLAKHALSEVLRIIREVDPPRPSEALTSSGSEATVIAHSRNTRIQTLSSELRRELEWIPLKAMRKERSRRYSSPLTLAEDVENYLAGRPLTAGPESRIYRLRKFSRRNRTALTTAAIFAALLIGGTLFYIQSIRTEQQRTQAALIERDAQATLAAQRADAEANARKEAEAVAQFQTDMLATADPEQLLGDKVTVLQAMQAAIQELDDGTLDDQPLVEAAVRNTIGVTLGALARYEEAEPNLRKALDLRRKALPADHSDIAISLNNLALLLGNQNQPAAAEPLYREALDIHRRALPAGHPKIADSLNNLASLLQEQNQPAEAEPLFRESLDIRRKSLPPGHPDIAISLNNLAFILDDQNKPAEAELLIREALDIRQKAFPAGHPDIANSLGSLGSLLQEQNKLAEAETLYRQALAIRRKSLPPGHPDIATSLNNLAFLLDDQDKPAQAEPLFREAIDIYRKSLPPGHPTMATSLSNLALLLQEQNKLAEAEPLAREALDIRHKSLPPGHPDIATSLNNLATLLSDQNKPAEAEPLLRESLQINRTAYPPGHPDIATSLRNLATLLEDLGRPDEAEPLYREALDIRRTLGPAPREDVASAAYYLGSCLARLGRHPEALPLLRESLENREALFGPTDPRTRRSASGLARSFDALNHTTEAAALRTQYNLPNPTTQPTP
jgi:serine/threonine protein kinase